MNALALLLLAAAPDAFPWNTPQKLEGADGTSLTWSIARSEERVVIEGTHTKWSVVHEAKADGTPLSTVKRANGKSARITYRANGAEFLPAGASTPLQIDEPGLWDAETLDARFAGIAWSKGRQVRFKILDVDSSDGSVYPMIAEGLGVEQCGAQRCQVVKLTLDGWRRPWGPTLLFRYSAEPPHAYLASVNDGKELKAR
jgi:hypothetical protein